MRIAVVTQMIAEAAPTQIPQPWWQSMREKPMVVDDDSRVVIAAPPPTTVFHKRQSGVAEPVVADGDGCSYY